MKIVAALLLNLSLLGLSAQEKQLSTESSKSSLEAMRAEKAALQASRPASRTVEFRPYTYRGFFVDLKKADDKAKVLSLRQPVNLREDSRNVYFDERTGRAKGFVLFAIDF